MCVSTTIDRPTYSECMNVILHANANICKHLFLNSSDFYAVKSTKKVLGGCS